MRSASTRRRTGAALASTSLAVLFAFSGTAFAGEKGQGDERRKDRNEAAADNGGHASGPITETEDTDAGATDEGGTATANNIVDDGDNAHPSGNDRSVENGGSGNQGKSQSDPDGDVNGGPDKPGMAGGDDLNDQDGNNGCGNDDDFEDDNNGNCGPKVRPTPVTPPTGGVGGTTETCPAGTSMPAGGTAPKDCETTVTAVGVTPGAVLGTDLQNPAPVTLGATEVPAQVLGVTVERAAVETAAAPAPTPAAGNRVLGAALARTGFSAPLLALLGVALVLFGVAVKRTA